MRWPRERLVSQLEDALQARMDKQAHDIRDLRARQAEDQYYIEWAKNAGKVLSERADNTARRLDALHKRLAALEDKPKRARKPKGGKR